jgi:hypothetical protein
MNLRGLGGTVFILGIGAALLLYFVPGGRCPGFHGMDPVDTCSTFANEARLVALGSAAFLVLCFLADGLIRRTRRRNL